MKLRNDIRKDIAERMTRPGRDGRLRRSAKVLVPVAFLLLAVVIAGFLIATRPQVAPKPVAERSWTVAAIPAEPVDIRPIRRFYGTIVAPRRVDIRAEVAGKVQATSGKFVEGGIVRAGDLLVEVDPFDYDTALRETEADIKGTQALIAREEERIKLLRRDVARREKLKGSGAGSEKTLDDSRLTLTQALQTQIERGNKLEKLEVERERIRRSLDDTKITAPADGFLSDVTTAIGKYLTVGDTLAKLVPATGLEARFHVGSGAFTRFLSGGSYRDVAVTVLWAGQEHKATLSRVESEVTTASGGIDVFARIEGLTLDTNLRPGAFVEVLVPGALYAGVVRVPEEAVHGGDTVYAIVDGRLSPRRVEIAGRDGSDAFVRGDFQPGDRLVVTRFPEIGPGLKVRERS
jgi:membrane fusion protein, multidrug efflux system